MALLDLMRSFGNNMVLVKEAINCPGFHGYFGPEAARLIDGQPPGSYLIRYDGQLIVNFVGKKIDDRFAYDEGDVQRYEIESTPVALDAPLSDIFIQLNCYSSFLGQRTPTLLSSGSYKNLVQLIAAHASWTAPFTAFSTELTSGFMGDLQGQETPTPMPAKYYIYRLTIGSGLMALTWYRDASQHTRIKVPADAAEFAESLKKWQCEKPFVPDFKVHQVPAVEFNSAQSGCFVENIFELLHELDRKGAHFSLSNLTKLSDQKFTCSSEAIERLANALSDNVSLTSVNLSCKAEHVPLLHALKCHPNITALTIRDGWGVNAVDVATDLIASLPRLQKLMVDGNDLFFAENLPKLWSLTLTSAPKVDKIDWLADLFKENQYRLQSLAFSFADEAVDILIGSQLAYLRNLKYLSASNTVLNHAKDFEVLKYNIEDLTVQFAGACEWDWTLPSKLQNLKRLTLNFPANTGTELCKQQAPEQTIRGFYAMTRFQFATNLHHHPGCKVQQLLSPKRNYWSFEHAAPCCLPVPATETMEMNVIRLSNIEHLHVHAMHADPTLLTKFHSWLPNCAKLKSLAFNACNLNTEQLQLLVEAIIGLSSLRRLEFFNFTVTGVQYGTAFVHQMAKKMPNLQFCKIDGGNMFDRLILDYKLEMAIFSGVLSHCTFVLPNERTNSNYIKYTAQRYTRQQSLVKKIVEKQHWLVGVISIVRDTALFNQLPKEIWELIFSQFSFTPHADALQTFRAIVKSPRKLFVVSDWGEILSE